MAKVLGILKSVLGVKEYGKRGKLMALQLDELLRSGDRKPKLRD